MIEGEYPEGSTPLMRDVCPVCGAPRQRLPADHMKSHPPVLRVPRQRGRP